MHAGGTAIVHIKRNPAAISKMELVIHVTNEEALNQQNNFIF